MAAIRGLHRRSFREARPVHGASKRSIEGTRSSAYAAKKASRSSIAFKGVSRSFRSDERSRGDQAVRSPDARSAHRAGRRGESTVLDRDRPGRPRLRASGARLVFSCGWHITLDGQATYTRGSSFALVKVVGLLGRLTRLAELDDQVEACRRIFASDTRWTVVRGSDLEEGESQGLPVWSRHVGDPILESNLTRRVDFALFMVEALEDDELSTRLRRSSDGRRPRRSRTAPASELGPRVRCRRASADPAALDSAPSGD